MFKTKYRIVTDKYAGYEVQCKKWWYPFWHQAWNTNTFMSLKSAIIAIASMNCAVVWQGSVEKAINEINNLN